MALANTQKTKKKGLFGGKQKQREGTSEIETVPTCVEFLPYKRFTNDGRAYLELKNGHGFIQIMAVEGKDLGTMNETEIIKTLTSYAEFLAKYIPDINIMSTKLPTSTTKQKIYWANRLRPVREQIMTTTSVHDKEQLQIREHDILEKLRILNSVEEELYNYEYLMFIFAETPRELDGLVRQAVNLSRGCLNLQKCTLEKKEMALYQFNNPNTKL